MSITAAVVILFFVFVIGTCIGSFLNVVALRAISGESIVFPSSKCPKCGAKLKPYDNIPIISYLILGGKCRNCKEHISLQYPIVEFLTGVGFVFMFIYTLPYMSIGTWKGLIIFPILCILFSLAMVMSITDFKEKYVYDVHTISFIVIAVISKFIFGDYVNTILGLITGIVSMELISLVSFLTIKKRAFGLGDTYITAGIGAMLGVKYYFVALAIAIVLQFICIFPSFIYNLYKEKEYKFLTAITSFIVLVLVQKLFIIRYFPQSPVTYLFVLLLLALGIYVCRSIFSLNLFKENLWTFPFGPALFIGFFLTYFYGVYIFDKIKIFLMG